MLEGKDIKRKWFNISSISDADITFAEFDEFKEERRTQRLATLNQEMAYYRQKAVKDAYSYIYQEGDADRIVNRNFERALAE